MVHALAYYGPRGPRGGEQECYAKMMNVLANSHSISVTIWYTG